MAYMSNYFYVFSEGEKKYLRSKGVRHQIAVTVAATNRTFWGYADNEQVINYLQEYAIKKELFPQPKVEVEQIEEPEQVVTVSVSTDQEQELRLALQQAFDIGEGEEVAERNN